MRCPSCGHDNRVDRRFCGRCGAALAIACAACGRANEPDEKFCGGCGTALTAEAPAIGAAAPAPKAEAASRTGERRQLTVLFCDLVGSTELSGRLDPEELRDLVGSYQEATAAVVDKHGGHIAQYLGDGVLVYFGYPTAHEDDAERAVRTGLGIVDALRPVNARLGADRQLAVRVGIHTGPVVVSELGGKTRRETQVFGETTNVAARVQGVAAPDTVVMSAATQTLVPGIFVLEDLGGQTLKGVAVPVVCYRVVQPSGVRSRLAIAAGRLTPFVGRDMELAALVERWERAASGDGQNVLLVGEAGVGKSRLAYQLRERLATIPHTWLECGATPYTEGTPFHPVMALVAQGLALTTTDTVAEKLEKIARGLRDLATPETVGLLADFLGLPSPTPLAMNPDVQRRKTMELLAQWNLALSTIQPLVLLVEDLHWCDASSLELFGRLIAQSATARMLFVATARPEFMPSWPARSNLTTLQLARLTKRQSREMVTTLLAHTLPAETVEALVTRADGVPLYVEELTKAVAEPGRAHGVEAIPTTLADSLMARLDRLSTAKEVAQRAAVLGREFGYPLLAAVVGMEDAGLRQGLARLVDAEIVFQRGEPPEATYTFKHALVQEAAYESLLKRTRQQLHGRVVDVLRERFPERIESEPEVVARHAEAAGRSDDAITYYARAGERAHARSAHEEAIGRLRKAIVLLETRPAGMERDAHELSLQLSLGASLTAARGYAHRETAAAYERAVTLAPAAGDAAWLDEARAGLAICYFNRGEVERGRALGAQVLSGAEARGDRERALILHAVLVAPEHVQGKFASSLAHCERVIAFYDSGPHGHVRMLSSDSGIVALNHCAWNLWQLGQPDAALARAREAISLARRLDDPFGLAFALFFETALHRFRRDVAAQRERATEVIALSETYGFPLWLGVGRAFHAAARVAAGEHTALPEIVNGLALAAETGSQAGAPGMLAVLAEAQRAAGRLAEAQGTVATALAIAAQTGQPYVDADLHRLDGDLVLATGSAAEEAAARYHRALAIAREQGARSFELRAATSLARLWRDQGKRTEARALLAPVYATFTEGFDTGDLLDAKALLDELKSLSSRRGVSIEISRADGSRGNRTLRRRTGAPKSTQTLAPEVHGDLRG
jgi:class 3 adenylate cyclase/predicted ATPase